MSVKYIAKYLKVPKEGDYNYLHPISIHKFLRGEDMFIYFHHFSPDSILWCVDPDSVPDNYYKNISLPIIKRTVRRFCEICRYSWSDDNICYLCSRDIYWRETMNNKNLVMKELLS
jgi:hypothetical protein